jgi:hypothetical protein
VPQSAEQFSGIFICYRREDSGGHAGRLYDRLVAHFGDEQIFMDLDRIEPGEDFVQVIERAIGSCKILLALIGRSWLTSRDETGRRLDNPNDFVRVEIASAFARDVRVIPVLVQGAQMPRAQDLPEVLRPLSRRHAFELSDLRWNQDVENFIGTLENILKRRRGERGQPQAHESPIQPSTSVPTKYQGSDYKPDELAKRVLRYIYLGEGINPVEDLSEQLKLDPLEIEVRLDKLMHGYVDYNEFALLHGNNPYSLSPEGKEYLLKTLYRRNEKVDQTILVLRSYRNNLSERALDRSDVDEYHSRLETLQEELGRDLSNFRIPPSAIKSRDIPQSFGMDMFGTTYGEPYYTEHYIPAATFKTYLDALIDHLDET